MEDFVSRMIEERIEPQDILHLVSEMGRLRDDGAEPGWFSQFAILADKFPRGSAKAIAIMERMQAFLPMLKDSRARGWSFDSIQPGCKMTHQAMFRAVALAPLHQTRQGRKLSFKRSEFYAIVLEQTDSEKPAC